MLEFKRQLIDLVTNPVLLCAAASWLMAQIIKIFTSPKYRDGMSFLRFIVGSGGMPSSHAAAVCGTCISCGILYGFDTALFAISAVLAVVVMRDAAGIRREAGKQAEVINQMSQEIQEINKKKKKNPFMAVSLKELLGHTPSQVLMGGLLGVIMAYICQYLLFPLFL